VELQTSHPGKKLRLRSRERVVPTTSTPHGKAVTVSRARIRGELQRHICSEYELDLGEDKDGILILAAAAVPGQALADYLGLDDIVLEIGITPKQARRA